MECAVAAVATHGREDGVMAVTTDDKSEFMTGWLAERIDYHYRHINTFNVLFKEFHMEIARSNTNMPRKWPPNLAAMCSATPGMVGLLPSRIGKIILFVKMRDRVSCSAAGGGDETTPSILERTSVPDPARARTHATGSPSKGGGAGTLKRKSLLRDAAGNLPSGSGRQKDKRKRGQSPELPDRGHAAQQALADANMSWDAFAKTTAGQCARYGKQCANKTAARIICTDCEKKFHPFCALKVDGIKTAACPCKKV